MRHIDIDQLLRAIYATADGKRDKRRLETAHKSVVKRPVKSRPAYVDGNGVRKRFVKGKADYINDNGTTKWTPLKERFTAILGNKCWYTEAELIGAPLTIDHFRPKRDYWFLAFKPDNFRVACPYANSPKHNALYGCLGGKGDVFPLLDQACKATGIRSVKHERPIILDPCNEDDCKLVAFQADGRPVIHPKFADDAEAINRLEKSNLLLNLDHPDFNTKREQLCKAIEQNVKSHEKLIADTEHQRDLRTTLARRLSKSAEFSVAARYYLGIHKHLDWVADMLKENPI